MERIGRLEADLNEVERLLDAVHAERNTLKEQLAILEYAQRQILTSRFWRTTRPLRVVWQWVGDRTRASR
jgi:hypothetical protein